MYTLSQVESVLQALQSGPSHTARRRLGQSVTPSFHNQVKRLLEIDRGRVRNGNPEPLAFAADLPIGRGTSASYSAFDTFCLALALELVSFGFKQAEVVAKLSALRRDLQRIHETVVKAKQVEGSTYVSDGPVQPVFIVFDRLELSRVEEGGATGDEKPAFAHGWNGLQEHLRRQASGMVLSAFIVELGELAVRAAELLPLAAQGPAD